MNEESRVQDLVEIPAVRTVVQLSDLTDSTLRSFLTDTFLLTEDIAMIFQAIFSSIVKKTGNGFLLEGSFGSGKSHFLSVLSLLLSDDQAWLPLLEQLGGEGILRQYYPEISRGNYLVVNISLVKHSNKENLEDIVAGRITRLFKKQEPGFAFAREEEFIKSVARMAGESYQGRLKSFLREKGLTEQELFRIGQLNLVEEFISRFNLPYRFNYQREEVFNQLTALLKDGPYDGIVILLDELSEYLRSKPDGRRFNEDIRFLQYLGELAAGEAIWIVATLQEAIEKTGETTPEAFNKIKDRYPGRFRLSGTHIRELVTRRLIKKKAGAGPQIKELFSYYRNHFPHWPVKEEEFVDLYPVHPLVINLLDNLKALFSQQRGIIDFIHYRLKGDPERNIEGILAEPALTLLTPEVIFDHFSVRIREMLETSPYYDKIYQYYRQEVERLLPDREDQELGLNLIKLLILFEISPLEKVYLVRDLADFLLYRVSMLDSGINYEHIDGILRRFYSQGAYLMLEEGASCLENRYYLKLDADLNLLIKRKTEYIKSNLFPEDHRIFTRLATLVNESFLPLKDLLSEPETSRTFTWQNTERKGFLSFVSLQEISPASLQKQADQLKKAEEDFAMIISHARPGQADAEYLKKVLLPELDSQALSSFVFWLPTALKETDFLQNVLARLLLLEDYQRDSSAAGQEIQRRLNEMIADDQERVVRIFREAYFTGKIINGRGEVLISLEKTGLLPFYGLLERVISNLLNQIFPYHGKIAPYNKYLTASQLEELREGLLVIGQLHDLKDIPVGLTRTIDSFLKPLGLIEKSGQGISLKVDPDRNPLLRHFFSLLEQDKTPLEQVYLQLRKGNYGLIHRQFMLLIAVLLYTGYITAYGKNKKIDLNRFSFSNFASIKAISYGEIIAEEFQEVLKECSLIPARFKKRSFSLLLQHQIWNYLVQRKGELKDELTELKGKLNQLSNADDFKSFNLERFYKYTEQLAELLTEIKVSYNSGEGLERFAAAYRSFPHLDQYLHRLAQLKDFLNNYWSSYRKIKGYLHHPALKIGGGKNYHALPSLYHNLLQSLQDDSVLLEDGFMDSLLRGFAEFQQLYIDYYWTAHQKEVAEERFLAYHKIREARDYRVLSLLAGIRMISVKDDLVKVDRMITRVLGKQCNLSNSEHLQLLPVCSCGFVPGQKIALTPVKEIRQTIEQGILQYLQALKSEQFGEKINSYLEKMEAVGEKRFARPIRELLLLEVGTDLVGELEQRLNGNVIKKINRALAGDITVVERDIDHLIENLVARSFSPEQIKNIFKEWLEGSEGLAEGSYIKIISEHNGLGKGQTGQDEALLIYLEEHYPELLTMLTEVGITDFSLLLLFAIWQQEYGLSEEGFNQLSREQGINPPDHSLRKILAQMATELLNNTFQWEVAGNVRQHLEPILERSELLVSLVKELGIDSLEQTLEIMIGERFLPQLVHYLLENILPRLLGTGLSQTELLPMIGRLEETKRGPEPKQEIERVKDIVFTFLLAFFNLKLSLFYLEGAETDNNYTSWAALYQKYLSSLEYDLKVIEQSAERLMITDRVPLSLLQKEVDFVLIKYQKSFRAFYRGKEFAVAEQKEQEVLQLGELLNVKFPHFLKSLNKKVGYPIMLDGMRWDLWKILREVLFSHLPLRMIEEGSLYALAPSNTERQLAQLRFDGFTGDVITPDLSGDKKGSIVKYNFIDEKIHTSKADYLSFIEEVVFQAENQLLPNLKNLPAGSPVLIFADHGYRINHHFSLDHKYEQPRYLHGGESFFELIVPWALIYKSS